MLKNGVEAPTGCSPDWSPPPLTLPYHTPHLTAPHLTAPHLTAPNLTSQTYPTKTYRNAPYHTSRAVPYHNTPHQTLPHRTNRTVSDILQISGLYWLGRRSRLLGSQRQDMRPFKHHGHRLTLTAPDEILTRQYTPATTSLGLHRTAYVIR